MNEFENRYFPLKRAFPRRIRDFCRDREIRSKRRRLPGGPLHHWQITLPTSLKQAKRKKLAFVSDWHWYNSPYQQKISAQFTAFMTGFSPDILLLGGDLCDDADSLSTLKKLLLSIAETAPLTVGIGGNWENGKRWLPEDFFADLYRSSGIILLENSQFDHAPFHITGTVDISSPEFHQLPATPKNKDTFHILLSHNPDGVVALDKRNFMEKFDLVFCGHNHGGQVRIPFYGAIYCPSFYHRKFDRGIFCHREYPFKMIVSSGIGKKRGTFRLFCPPEVVTVELV